MKMAAIGSHIGVFNPQLVNCLGRIKMCGLLGGGMSLGLGYEIPQTPVRPSSSFSAVPRDLDIKSPATVQHYTCLPDCHRDPHHVDKGLSEAVSRLPIQCFLL